VTLTKDVSSRYRKLTPRAQAGGSAKAHSPHSKGHTARPERGGHHPKHFRRRDDPGPGSGLPEALKAMLDLELPEATRQLREAQTLLQSTAEEMLTLLEDWEGRPPEETQGSQALVTALYEKMSFQDLAGQRLAKVEKFLKALPESVQPGASVDSFRPRQVESSGTRPSPSQDKPQEEKTLRGPQMAENRLGQSEVDQVLMALLLR
jgi:hypothetical protein